MKKKSKAKSAEEFDRRFNENEDIFDIADIEVTTRRVLIELPLWMLQALDKEAKRLNNPRTALIRSAIDEYLKKDKARVS